MNKELRVLVVEDSPQDMALINHELRKAGLHIRSRRVESREAFLHELEHHPPDVILSDHNVPGFDGFAAFSEARNLCPEAPFIFVSGATREEAARGTLQSGADDYVLKDHLNLLGPAIKRALGESRARANHPTEKRVAQLEAAAREMETFSYRIGRDLQVPLRNIESCSELLAKTAGGQLDPKSQGYLKAISESARRMDRLIDDLLNFSRAGQTEMYRLNLSLKEIAKEVIHEFRHETEGREVEWVLGELPEVSGDSVMLWQVMTNLISNALKFTRNRPRARIEVGASDSEREQVIFVRDNGVGFPSQKAAQLFSVFKRLHNSEFEGNGVGLASVRRIIERHGGRVWAEGEEDAGATFFFSMPK